MITIGSRGSKLALWQSNWVASRLREAGLASRVRVIKTTGDKIADVALSKVGAKGLFTKELEEALLEGSIDMAVHSLKDMPTSLPEGLVLAAVPEREDPRDALVGRRLDQLEDGARVGTSSLRRAAQLRAARPLLVVESVRGNLDTRLRKLDEGHYDAIVLAAAGLRRLGWEDRIAQLLEPDFMCPAAGQGALAVEVRAGDEEIATACAALDHAETRAAVSAERALLHALGGGCQVPLGAHATIHNGRLHLLGVVVSPSGGVVVRGAREGDAMEAETIGEELAAILLDAGAQQILEDVHGAQ